MKHRSASGRNKLDSVRFFFLIINHSEINKCEFDILILQLSFAADRYESDEWEHDDGTLTFKLAVIVGSGISWSGVCTMTKSAGQIDDKITNWNEWKKRRKTKAK